MAGRKQHFIPRHFLKEFVVPDGNDKLWLYRRGLPQPVPVSRDDAAATRDFYSKPAETDAPTLDDLITEYEDVLKYRVEEVRATSAGDPLPAHLISEITVHLALRAAYLREFIEVGASELVSSIDALIHQPNKVIESIELPRHRVPSKFEAMAIEQFEKHQPSLFTNVTPKAIVRLLYFAIREDLDLLQRAASNEFSNFLARFQSEVGGLGGNAHVQVLKKELAPAPRKALLEEFEWKVIAYPAGDAVLPDCIAIAEDANGWGPYVVAEHKSMTRVVMPLSSSKLAVGSATHDWEDVTESYNQSACDSCFTFYLTNRKEEVPQNHLAELGGPARAKIAKITSSALREAVGEFIGDGSSREQEEAQLVTWADLSLNTGLSYSVSFKDFGDEAYAKRVADALNEVVKSFSSFFPIHQLDGITFAEDYAAALQDLDRGEDVSRSIDASAGTNPNGVAMPLAVRRKDGIKTHIVLRGHFAEYLISEDEGLYDDAFSVICYSLGTVAFNALIEAKYPGTILAPHADSYEGWLYQYNDALLATYFSTRLLGSGKDTLDFYADQASEQLDRMTTVTTEAHTRYQAEGDHEKFFNVCATHVSGFMTSMARYHAARASIIGPHQANTPLDTYLSQLELAKWSRLFQEDLAAFNRGLDDWANLDEINFLNRHFERLLLEVGVFPDQLEDGSLYVRTSNAHRLAARI